MWGRRTSRAGAGGSVGGGRGGSVGSLSYTEEAGRGTAFLGCESRAKEAWLRPSCFLNRGVI